jgi:hypothetical protein
MLDRLRTQTSNSNLMLQSLIDEKVPAPPFLALTDDAVLVSAEGQRWVHTIEELLDAVSLKGEFRHDYRRLSSFL